MLASQQQDTTITSESKKSADVDESLMKKDLNVLEDYQIELLTEDIFDETADLVAEMFFKSEPIGFAIESSLED